MFKLMIKLYLTNGIISEFDDKTPIIVGKYPDQEVGKC